MTTLSVSAIQYNIHWEDKQANFRKIEELCSPIEKTDLIVLPEMFSTGFSMNVSTLAEPMSGATLRWMKQMAQKYNAAICGSAIISENNAFYNRFLFVAPEGEVKSYDKRHLFTMGEEQKTYVRGNQRIIINFRGFRIFPIICYDLRFPVWSRNRQDYDLLICVANWPSPRRRVWKTLLKARAIENQAYMIAANRTGTDANGIIYQGDSLTIDAKGKICEKLPPNWEGVITDHLDLESLQRFRKKFPVLDDADSLT